MGTLNTSINITSKDTLAFSLNQTVKSAGSTGEFAESGTKTVTPLLSTSLAVGAGLLSTRACGANGAYVFVENPSTNTNNVELVGAADLYNAVSASAGDFSLITGLNSFITLKPGDSTIVPLTSGQAGVYVYTTYGTSTINYYIADREGAFGQSGLILTGGINYRYTVLDAQAGVLSGGNPTPYFTSIDTGVTASYAAIVDGIINNKGYAIRFTDNLDATHKIYKFIDTKGQIIGTVDITDVGESTLSLDEMGGYVVAYDTGSDAVIEYFDGDILYSHTIEGNYYSLASSQDQCSSDGAFVLRINNYLGNSGDQACVLFNKGNHYILSVTNLGTTDLLVDDVATSFYGSFFFLSIYNDFDTIYTRFQIWSTNGVLLKDLDVTDFYLGSIDYVLYGSNKLQIIATTMGLDYLLNYNGATNHLIGHNSTNPQLPLLNWSHTNTGNYGTNYIYAYDKYPTDSIRNYNYDWNSGMYDAESVAIVYSDAANNQSGFHINSEVAYCDIVYVMAGATTYGVHQFTNGYYKYIRIPSQFGYNRVTPSSNLIAFNTSAGTYESGSLQILAITPTGVASSSLVPKLEDIDNANGQILAAPVGEYILYRTYNNVTSKPTYTMTKSATRKGSVTISNNGYDLYTRCNSVGLFDYNLNKGWYFNTSTNAFVELSNVFNWYDGSYQVNRSTTVNGLNDGNILIVPDSLNSTANAKMRLLKSGIATAEKQLPVTNGNWSLKLGSEAVFLVYQDMTDAYKFKVNVYDLNLNLVKTVPLNLDDWDRLEVVGKRCYIRTYNVDKLLGDNYYSYYMISLEGMAYWLHADNDSIVFNDKWWDNFEA